MSLISKSTVINSFKGTEEKNFSAFVWTMSIRHVKGNQINLNTVNETPEPTMGNKNSFQTFLKSQRSM